MRFSMDELYQIIVELSDICSEEGGESKKKADFVLEEKGYKMQRHLQDNNEE